MEKNITVSDQLKTILDYVRYAMSLFERAGVHYGHGTDNAWDEALALILPLLHLGHDLDKKLLEARLLMDERVALVERIHMRAELRIPVPYLTGKAWFCNLEFNVDPRVLIPRSLLGSLIQNHFEPWIEADRIDSILELCTGSGCIAIACANAFPQALVHATELSEDALAVARSNLEKHDLTSDITLFQTDLFPPRSEQRYSVILANPPYVGFAEWEALPPEYHHEPRMALVAPEEGLELVARILRDAPDYLHDDGILIVEVGNSAALVEERWPELAFLWLDTDHDEGGVFLLTAQQLITWRGEHVR